MQDQDEQDESAETKAEDDARRSGLHGEHHPPLNIVFQSSPLTCATNTAEMLFKFILVGALPGFQYRVYVQDFDANGVSPVRQQEEVMFAMGANASANQVVVILVFM